MAGGILGKAPGPRKVRSCRKRREIDNGPARQRRVGRPAITGDIPRRFQMTNLIRSISRRGALVLAGAAVLATLAIASPASAQEKKKVLFLTKSSGFQHSAIARKATDPTKP